jgi:hypothetical protein
MSETHAVSAKPSSSEPLPFGKVQEIGGQIDRHHAEYENISTLFDASKKVDTAATQLAMRLERMGVAEAETQRLCAALRESYARPEWRHMGYNADAIVNTIANEVEAHNPHVVNVTMLKRSAVPKAAGGAAQNVDNVVQLNRAVEIPAQEKLAINTSEITMDGVLTKARTGLGEEKSKAILDEVAGWSQKVPASHVERLATQAKFYAGLNLLGAALLTADGIRRLSESRAPDETGQKKTDFGTAAIGAIELMLAAGSALLAHDQLRPARAILFR